ncbi:MAG: hypothetical protein KF764_32935 [Labilithrix sp.]|nr:hypothetical protein [Labilithrix sp.]MBX3225205.1 hypothetical protein [Labilithrix sp.]
MRSSFPSPARLLLVALPASLASCAGATPDDARTDAGAAAITTAAAEVLDFRFHGEVIAGPSTPARDAIVQQLLYVFGALRTSSDASGQIGNVVLSDVTETASGDQRRIAYRASLPVAWPRGDAPPASYDLVLPRDASALETFNRKYDGRCGRSDHGAENFWHDFRPGALTCMLADADVVRPAAAVTAHAEAPPKYPEYGLVWADGRLDAVAIFTIIGRNAPDDWGYTEAQRFLDDARRGLEGASVTENRASRSVLRDATLTGKVMHGGRLRDVEVDVLVVESIDDAGADFDERYDALSERADLVLFNGHAKLGANTNALGQKGKVVAGKYQLVLLNACDTFALVDSAMTDRRRARNGAAIDPKGTKFLDVISNARPGYASNLANVAGEVYGAALGSDWPKSYDAIVGAMPASHVAIVYGEEDNTFVPLRFLPIVFEPRAFAIDRASRGPGR